MSDNITGKVVVNPGASSGLGEAIARLLSPQGATSRWVRGTSTFSNRSQTN